jgi:hypothetical protein
MRCKKSKIRIQQSSIVNPARPPPRAEALCYLARVGHAAKNQKSAFNNHQSSIPPIHRHALKRWTTLPVSDAAGPDARPPRRAEARCYLARIGR